jgi:hypothetical protein
MSDLLKPGTYRLPAYQDEWLQKQARKAGHTAKVNILRQLLDREIEKEASPRKKGQRP